MAPMHLTIKRRCFNFPTSTEPYVMIHYYLDVSEAVGGGNDDPVVLLSFVDKEMKLWANSAEVNSVTSTWSGNPTATFSTSTGLTIKSSYPGGALIANNSNCSIHMSIFVDRSGFHGYYGSPYPWTAPTQCSTSAVNQGSGTVHYYSDPIDLP